MDMDIDRLHLDFISGQHEYVIVAKDGGEIVGQLFYSLFENVPHVKIIEAYRPRERVGTSLVLQLQEYYPDTPIQFGGLTEDGVALLNSMEWLCVPNEGHLAAKRGLDVVRARLRDYSTRATELASATQAERDAFNIECADWNDLYDLEDRLLDTVTHTPPELRFVIGGKPMRTPELQANAPRA
jgi:hypothetical protein